MAEEMGIMSEDRPLQADMPTEARENLMSPSESIQTVLMARLTELSKEELNMLDEVITPEVTRVLIKLLPELTDLINAVMNQGAENMEEADALPSDMGALGNV